MDEYLSLARGKSQQPTIESIVSLPLFICGIFLLLGPLDCCDLDASSLGSHASFTQYGRDPNPTGAIATDQLPHPPKPWPPCLVSSIRLSVGACHYIPVLGLVLSWLPVKKQPNPIPIDPICIYLQTCLLDSRSRPVCGRSTRARILLPCLPVLCHAAQEDQEGSSGRRSGFGR